MSRHSRMIKMLVCLAGAMIGSAALLSWLDPSGQPPKRVADTERLAVSIHSLVAGATSIDVSRWREIEVLAGEYVPHRRRMLSATSQYWECHFAIDSDGGLHCTDEWRSQVSFPDAPDTVRVQVHQTRSREPMTWAQFTTLNTLVEALSRQVSDPPARLPIRLAEDWAEVYGRSNGSLFAATITARPWG